MVIKFVDIVKITLAPFLIYLLNAVLEGIWPGVSLAWRLDNYLHVMGGMAIAASSLVVLRLAERLDWIKIKNAAAALLLVVGFVAAAAALWEFYEFLHDYFYGTHFQPSNADTMADLFMGMLGGAAWYIGHWVRKRSAL